MVTHGLASIAITARLTGTKNPRYKYGQNEQNYIQQFDLHQMRRARKLLAKKGETGDICNLLARDPTWRLQIASRYDQNPSSITAKMAAAAMQAAEIPTATEETITAAAAQYRDELPVPGQAQAPNPVKKAALKIRDELGASRGWSWKHYAPVPHPTSPPRQQRSRSRPSPHQNRHRN